MKKTLLFTVVAALAVSASAQDVQRVNAADRNITPMQVVNRAARLRAAAPATGVHSLKSLGKHALPMRENSTINPAAFRKSVLRAEGQLPEGYALYESFEGMPEGEESWLPEGWTCISNGDPELEYYQKWKVSGASMLMPAPSDGNYYVAIQYATLDQDEWLITPVVDVAENMQFSFTGYIDPTFLFSLDNVDWNAYEFVGPKEIAATLKVMAREEDGEWQEIWDAADKYADYTLRELTFATPEGLEPYNIDISDYTGKKAQFALRYVGTDGNTMAFDEIAVKLPSVDITYSRPYETLFWGFGPEPGWSSINLDIAQYPVLSPVTWTHMNYLTGATYQWQYCDPVDGNWITDDNQEELTVTYVPDYRSASSTKNNLFYPPVLTAEVAGAAPGSYQDYYTYFQAGGKAELTLSDGEFTAGLLPFAQAAEGLTFLTAEADFGQLSTPIAGYDYKTDNFWREYTFRTAFGDEEIPEDYISYVDGFLNCIFPASTPLVVESVSVLARGIIAEGAAPSLNLAIYPLNDDGTINYDALVASAVSAGDDIIAYNPAEYSLDFLTCNFTFDSPVVLGNDNPAYVVIVSGYHDAGFEYFAPMQSELPHPDSLNYGYLLKYSDYPEQGGLRMGLVPLAYLEGEYGPCFNSFAINLYGHYGWLKSDVEEITLPADGTAVNVPFDSYYEGSELTVSGVDGITVVGTGRYGETNLAISREATDEVLDGVLTVSVPGISHDIRVKQEVSGISALTTPGATLSGVFNLAGVELGSDNNLAPGVYIFRYSDGSARKVQVK